MSYRLYPMLEKEPKLKKSFDPIKRILSSDTAFIIYAILAVFSIIAAVFAVIARENAINTAQCSPDFYVGTYWAASGLSLVRCMDQNGKTRDIYIKN